MESSASSVSFEDSKRSLIWSHFTQIGSDNTNMSLRCHKNSWIYLTSTYYWWFLRPTITIRFDSKFQIIAQLFSIQFHSIRKEKTLFVQHYCQMQSGILFVKVPGEICATYFTSLHHRNLREKLINNVASVGRYNKLQQKQNQYDTKLHKRRR